MKTKSNTSVPLSDDTLQPRLNYGKSIGVLWAILVTLLPASAMATIPTKVQCPQRYTELQPVAASSTTPLQRPAIAFESETPLLMPAGYTKTIEEVIAEDKLITESKWENDMVSVTDSPLEQMIQEDNLIIESNITHEVFPLTTINSIAK